ncbi:MAG: hypothetical protein COU08_02775 [Candidatus Harrisonbacteria bacterium CG10_big_fil_rev_8_21_14_0_10_42_17]|uniref:DUF8128 domain-containing protein n=1 Tax=Candidatus Harrisonbacteria bacterium CG10_big_fil_rev_8_21_14_0_10_42_17 TaxID=1974584 RepID=A0A2M6WI50_9BACT|nr:MAG: hypothetical protein COU08_02775 [Candidatus Harrisonbacteria bacterium CG10_big_fil_rev_8_21_14_0_10_42_17]
MPDILGIIKEAFIATWPLMLFVVLAPITHSLLVFWRNEEFLGKVKYSLLELRIPREIKKSPRAMEQILTALHSLRSFPVDVNDKYIKGVTAVNFSLELVSFGGEVRFFIRTEESQQKIVEAAFFAYYQDIEVVEVEDYAITLPGTLREMERGGFDIWGTEVVLAREDAYPIKTYVDFEGIDEDKQFDPIATFLEILSKAKSGEIIGIQLIIDPVDHKWKDAWKGLLDRLRQTQALKSTDPTQQLKALSKSPGETDVIKAVEANLSKNAFDSLIRLIYISPRSSFYNLFGAGLFGAFNQFSALHLNSFKPNGPTGTKTKVWIFPYVLPKLRTRYRKQRLLMNYRNRETPKGTFMGKLLTSSVFNTNFHSRSYILNTEAIATLFHPPTFGTLTAPHINRMESKKTGAPAGLPIFGEGTEIEEFQ